MTTISHEDVLKTLAIMRPYYGSYHMSVLDNFLERILELENKVKEKLEEKT